MTEKKPKLTDASKKFKIQDLPDEVDRQVWRRTFVPTFMMHVARQDNPFEHNVKAGCAAMQKIWDELVGTPYNIVHSSPIYQLVRIFSIHYYVKVFNIYVADYATCF